MADLCDVVAVGTEHGALTAEGAGIDGLIHHVVAHNDRYIVVYLPRQHPGELFIVLQIGAALDALIAAALDAALCLGYGAFSVVNLDAA